MAEIIYPKFRSGPRLPRFLRRASLLGYRSTLRGYIPKLETAMERSLCVGDVVGVAVFVGGGYLGALLLWGLVTNPYAHLLVSVALLCFGLRGLRR